jgi:two-component sensor histidine kinase
MMKSGVDDYVVKHARQLPRLRASMKLAVEAAQHRSELTDRERQLTAALAHKDLLVRELHHRVKNNLQTIITLLDIRARLKGGEVAEDLLELAGRMRALAKVQAQLYDSQRLDRVDFTRVVVEMATELANAYRGAVRLQVEKAEPIEMDVSRAMPLALICYELLLNAVKHAWPDGREGLLRLTAIHNGQGAEVRIADDGVGLPADGRSTGFGSKLVPPLAKEANARVTTEAQHGGGIVSTVFLQ